MTDLDPRLHRLRDAAVPPGPDPAEVRARAGRRRARRHRRTLLAVVPAVVVLVVAAAVLATGDDGTQSVVTGSDPITTEAPTTSSTTPATPGEGLAIGNADGVAIQVSPTAGLVDGQLVTVEIDGLDRLTTPEIILCAGDVDAATAARDCDLSPLEPGGASEGIDGPVATQQVAVRRVIRIPRMADESDDQGGDYDCAAEPAGCALVVGNSTLPAVGVGVRVAFAAADRAEPEVTASPATGLADRVEVDVEATGLRPNSTYQLTQCSTSAVPVCDEMTWTEAKTGADGDLRATYTATAAIYGWRGRADCTAKPCVIQIGSEYDGGGQAEIPIAFATGTVAPVPRLEIAPAGPYEDQQAVTVTGTGFPVGHDVGWELGQCPNDKDTAVEERCGYDTTVSNVIVDGDGRFTAQVRLHRSGACSQPAGCHLGWVINHGPTLAKVPLEFR